MDIKKKVTADPFLYTGVRRLTRAAMSHGLIHNSQCSFCLWESHLPAGCSVGNSFSSSTHKSRDTQRRLHLPEQSTRVTWDTEVMATTSVKLGKPISAIAPLSTCYTPGSSAGQKAKCIGRAGTSDFDATHFDIGEGLCTESRGTDTLSVDGPGVHVGQASAGFPGSKAGICACT